MHHRHQYLVAFVLSLVFVSGSGLSQPRTKLTPETVQAFEGYLSKVESELQKGLERNGAPAWLTSPDRLDDGTIVVEEVSSPSIPSGIIHDWRGKMFVPGVDPEAVIGVLKNYNRHAGIYPEVVESRIVSEDGDHLTAFLRFRKTQVLTVVLNTEHAVEVAKAPSQGWRLTSRSTRIAEVRSPDTAEEKELPVGDDSGFLWRLNAYWSIRKAVGGTLVECVTVSLSRDIPLGLGWLIKPFVSEMPRESLYETLQATRLALKN